MSAFFRVIRIKNLLIIALMQYLLRYGLLIPIMESQEITPALSHLMFGFLVLSTLFLAASGYVINDYFDIKIDKVNRPEKVVVGEEMSRRTALFIHVLFTLTGVFIGLFYAHITRKENYALMYLAIPIILWFYSTTFKKQILIGNLLIAFLTALVPYMVVSLEFAFLTRFGSSQSLTADVSSVGWFWTSGFAFFAFLTTLVREIIKDMEDVTGDKNGGCRTLPIEIGMNYSKVIVILLTLATIGAIWGGYYLIPELHSNWYVLWYFLVLLTLPQLILIGLIIRAFSASNYHWASNVSKIVMVFGILFIFLIGQIY